MGGEGESGGEQAEGESGGVPADDGERVDGTRRSGRQCAGGRWRAERLGRLALTPLMGVCGFHMS